MAYLDNIAVFVRVVELGNLSAAGRDMRLSPAVASNRIKELEKHLGVRLFNRTTRQLMPTEHGTVFYTGAKQVLDAITEAEAAVAALSGQPRGTIRVMAPLGLGRRLIASGIPDFHDKYPDIEVRLRLSDHNVDIMKEGIDVAFRLGIIEDSSLRMRGVLECERVLVAAPKYLETRGEPAEPQELVGKKHDCLMLRYAGTREFVWALQTPNGVQKFEVHGPYDTDDGDVLTGWALSGRGIINKPRFEVEPFIRDQRLKVILAKTPPTPVQLAAVYPHKKLQDPKVRLLLDFMAERCQRLIRDILAGK
ncbi:LysR family transcriptional regulator [Mesorhizobium sp. M2D.F.Ca.ET.185.01.1.1]|uniref:LysR family transcriptional regulator n=1 Tax=unclassified Mesorhizobium TaxID=325217 RepID=UPI000FCA8E2C|nr:MULTISPECIES: LysR family transcriptional regulator [unclassified Mesorhizobium]TGP82217.1 LysR family transcriptional regulator [bacterium M00.F.Ca.ET.227.01.1.1]TGP91899.1 LysR family transcriptional regulator [bacterium M00.F.Ca.ET.221.01.1.1]TGP95315.1 LysR family transcriptional regulator [bacterium M00.F.Ca.ET.222.01.1.1]TGT71431.1 LysR family transcriptional regulator [bacterium M00.F.Ca.ET.159.01.1.1]TGT83608.1 LysR family transcriptional regulator [bacterium M00.F.Ca.ET.157.01.1.1]